MEKKNYTVFGAVGNRDYFDRVNHLSPAQAALDKKKRDLIKVNETKLVAASADIKNGMSYGEASLKYGITIFPEPPGQQAKLIIGGAIAGIAGGPAGIALGVASGIAANEVKNKKAIEAVRIEATYLQNSIIAQQAAEKAAVIEAEQAAIIETSKQAGFLSTSSNMTIMILLITGAVLMFILFKPK